MIAQEKSRTYSLGKDAYGRVVEAEKTVDHNGHKVWRLIAHASSQLDQSEKVWSLTDGNIEALVDALQQAK